MSTSMFIAFDGPAINGGTTIKGQEGKSEILSFEHSFTQPTTLTRSHGGGASVEKAQHAPLTFTKILDSATDDLLKMCWTGKHIATAEILCFRTDGTPGTGTPYLSVQLESVVVTSYHISSGAGDVPHETISLNYGKVTYTYTGHDKTKGTMAAATPSSWDLRTGEGA